MMGCNPSTLEFQASLGYILRPYLNRIQNKTIQCLEEDIHDRREVWDCAPSLYQWEFWSHVLGGWFTDTV
jgi:hypothetical protein